jgi:hypothetical protein
MAVFKPFFQNNRVQKTREKLRLTKRNKPTKADFKSVFYVQQQFAIND